MALKDKLMTLEDFKAVRDVDVASNSAQFTEIKADLDAIDTGRKIIHFDWNPGYYYKTGVVRTPTDAHEVYSNKVAVSEGDILHVSLTHPTTHDMWLVYCAYDTNESFTGRTIALDASGSSWQNDIYISADGFIAFSYRTHDDATFKCEVDSDLFAAIDTKIENAIAPITADEQAVEYTTTAGYIYTNGGHKSATANLEVYTNNIPVSKGDVLRIHEEHETAHDLWLVYGCYDANGTFIRPRGAIEPFGEEEDETELDAVVTIQHDGFIAFSWRTYGDSTFLIWKKTPIGRNAEKISILENNAVYGQYHAVRAINHRGFEDEPENTLPAYILSKKKGFDYVETDVRFTSDSVPVLLHDSSINRTGTNADGTTISGTVYIADITYEAAITNYKVGGGAIPRFEDFIALCRSLGLHPYIEVKTGTTEQIASLIDIVKRYGLLRKVTWISDTLANLTAVCSADPKARVAPIVSTYGANLINNTLVYRNGGADIFLDLRYDKVGDYLTDAMANDIPIEVWGTTTEAQILSMDAYVSGFTTDRDKAWEVLGRSYLVN